MSKELIVTPFMKEVAKDNKGIGILTMGCVQFLELTTPGSFARWMEEEKADTAPLETYNEAAKAGKIRVMPFLDVDRATGMVQGHEGRHRVAALIAANGTEVQVAICLRDKGYKQYYEQPFIDESSSPKQFYKRFLGIRDVPPRFLGQFKTSSVRIQPINSSDWEPFYTRQQTEMASVPGPKLLRPVSDFYRKKGS
jgi:hypothetical protein